MPDTEPGRTRTESGWPGHWVSTTRADYAALRESAGGEHTLTVFSSLTHPQGRNYTWTAWGGRHAAVPLVAFEADGCNYAPKAEDCPGAHTFWRFAHEPEEGTDA